ncbi:MAG: phBC6A51 family helix-turn-helix protein [Patescibacteria group bacterium]|nr:phBC6A51 family helix-turn-helix protein [Patescibacteria group bacterium]
MKKDKTKKLIIDRLSQTPIVQIICEKTGVGRATYYRWRKEDPEFKKETDKAIQQGLLLVNDLAESQLISAIKDQNLSAITFWLRHHHGTYGNHLEITAKLRIQDEELTPEEEALIKEALSLASLNTKGFDNKQLKEEKEK